MNLKENRLQAMEVKYLRKVEGMRRMNEKIVQDNGRSKSNVIKRKNRRK